MAANLGNTYEVAAKRVRREEIKRDIDSLVGKLRSDIARALALLVGPTKGELSRLGCLRSGTGKAHIEKCRAAIEGRIAKNSPRAGIANCSLYFDRDYPAGIYDYEPNNVLSPTWKTLVALSSELVDLLQRWLNHHGTAVQIAFPYSPSFENFNDAKSLYPLEWVNRLLQNCYFNYGSEPQTIKFDGPRRPSVLVVDGKITLEAPTPPLTAEQEYEKRNKFALLTHSELEESDSFRFELAQALDKALLLLDSPFMAQHFIVTPRWALGDDREKHPRGNRGSREVVVNQLDGTQRTARLRLKCLQKIKKLLDACSQWITMQKADFDAMIRDIKAPIHGLGTPDGDALAECFERDGQRARATISATHFEWEPNWDD